MRNSKIQVQNKIQTLRKSYALLNKVYTHREHINISNYNNHKNNNRNKYIYKKMKERKEKKNYKHLFET